MFSFAMKRAIKALFPIVRDVRGDEYRPMGSAFFVGRGGLFVTCAHLMKRDEIAAYQYLGRLPHRHHPVLDLEVLEVDEAADIAIGRVIGLETPGILRFEDAEPQSGAAMCIVGYPGFCNVTGQGEEPRPYLQPTFLIEYQSFGPNMRRSMVMRDNPYFGMSGGPVVDVKGNVLGLQSAVTHPRVNIGGDGRAFQVSNGVAVLTADIKRVLAKVQGMRSLNTGVTGE